MLEILHEEIDVSRPDFEFDANKSARTKTDPNRGIDFVEAQQIWEDPDRFETPTRLSTESRRVVVGRFYGKLWAAIVTNRGTNIRIISVRRARKKEEELYERKHETRHGHQP